jgi:formate-dependent nitrite reductase cytochrome c552 subunit
MKRIGGEKVKRDNWTKLFQSPSEQRRDYYNNEYLKSDEWKRKRYVVLKRDNWRCVHCGARATQVHHKKYARKNIGKEPIEWLESVCKACHDRLHR